MADNEKRIIIKEDLGFNILVELSTPQEHLGLITIAPLQPKPHNQQPKKTAKEYQDKIIAALKAKGGEVTIKASNAANGWWSYQVGITKLPEMGKGKTLIDVITAICDQIDNAGKTQTGHTSKTAPMMVQLKAETARYRNLRAGFRGIINKYELDRAFADENGTVVNQRAVREALITRLVEAAKPFTESDAGFNQFQDKLVEILQEERFKKLSLSDTMMEKLMGEFTRAMANFVAEDGKREHGNGPGY